MEFFLGLGLAIMLTSFVVSVLSIIFWVWLMLDCVQRDFREPTMKIVWIVLMVVLPFLGSVLYFFLEKYPADKKGA